MSPVGWHWACLKVSQTFCQCVFSQGFGHEGWTLPTQRTQGQCTVSFWSLDPLPFPRQLAHLPSLSELSVPSGQQQRLRLRACGWWYQQVPLAAALGQEELSLKAQSRRPHGRPGRPGQLCPLALSTLCVLTRKNTIAHGSPGSGEVPQTSSCSECLCMLWLFSILHILECLYFNKPLPLHKQPGVPSDFSIG